MQKKNNSINRIILFLLIINLDIFVSSTEKDCSSFETTLKQKCINFDINDNDHQCYYSNNKCLTRDKYTNCADYKGTSGNIDKDICESIIVSGKKCVVEGSQCIEANSCKYFSDPVNCNNFNPGEGKRCLFIKNKCEAHYEECKDIDEENLCNANIPNPSKYSPNKYSKCSWDKTGETPSCKAIDRLCSEYSDIKDIGLGLLCIDFKASTETKTCISDDDTCVEEELVGCDEYKGDKEADCKTYKSIDEFGKLQPFYKCAFKDTNEEGKKCYDLKYITCNDYNTYVKKEDRKDTECQAIIPRQDDFSIDVHYNCVYDSDAKECKKEKKECKEIKDKETCFAHSLDETKKQCIFWKNECIEQYNSCENYETNVKAEDKKSEDCIIIQETPTKRCDYTDKSVCTAVTKTKCNEYQSGQPEAYCTSITLNDTHKCELIDNKCVETFKSCESYKEKEGKEISREICESIIPSESNNRCILEDDTSCKTIPKECSDYKGDLENECIENYAPLDIKNYKCTFKDNKCIEVPNYSSCSNYIGKDKNICESIEILEPEKYKCSLVNEKCQRIQKPCSDAKDAIECSKISLLDSKKKCVFIDNKCTEQYKTCKDYMDDVDIVKEDICTKIISYEEVEEGSEAITKIKKCTYEAPKNEGDKGKCTSTDRKCEDFDVEQIQTECSLISLDDSTKKCVYNKGTCSINDKFCTEIGFLSGEKDVEEKCKSAPTQDKNKICSIKSNNLGCKEIDKSEDSSSTKDSTKDTTKKDNTKKDTTTTKDANNNENNYGKEKYLNKFLIIILCLLF